MTRQRVQTQIQLVFPICYSYKHFEYCSPDYQHLIWEQKEKSVRIRNYYLYREKCSKFYNIYRNHFIEKGVRFFITLTVFIFIEKSVRKYNIYRNYFYREKCSKFYTILHNHFIKKNVRNFITFTVIIFIEKCVRNVITFNVIIFIEKNVRTFITFTVIVLFIARWALETQKPHRRCEVWDSHEHWVRETGEEE